MSKLAAVTARGSPLARAGASEASTQTDLRSLTARCAELEQQLGFVEPLDHDDHVEPERLRVERGPEVLCILEAIAQD